MQAAQGLKTRAIDGITNWYPTTARLVRAVFIPEKDMKHPFRSISTQRLPEPGQPIALVIETLDDEEASAKDKHSYRYQANGFPHGAAFIFDTSDHSVYARIAKATCAAHSAHDEVIDLVAYESEGRLLCWQSEEGAVYGHKRADDGPLPFVPPIPGVGVDGQMRTVIIHADGSVDHDPCESCEMGVKLFCSMNGGPRNVLVALEKEPRLSGCKLAVIGTHRSDGGPWSAWGDTKLMNIMTSNGTETHGRVMKPADLRAAGFWVTNRLALFREDLGINRKFIDIDALNELVDSGLFEADDPTVMAKDRGVSFNAGDILLPDETDGVHVVDLNFDWRRVRAGVAATFLATRERAAGTRERARIRREHCRPCVYDCRFRPKECTLTEQQILDGYQGTIEQRRWMAMFTFASARVRLGSARVDQIVFGPEYAYFTPWFATRKAKRGFEHKSFHASVVIGDDWQARIDAVAERIEWLGTKSQALTYWALRQLWSFSHWRHDNAEFLKEDTQKGFRTRNDVLFISLDHGLAQIVVGSDTNASQHGGRSFVRRDKSEPPPPTIKSSERPRFRTTYTYPDYAKHILRWTGEPLGTSKTYRSSRILAILGQEEGQETKTT